MPAEMMQTRRRFLSIQDGRMKEKIGDQIKEYNHLSGLHVINATFRDAEKEENGVKKVIGSVLQLHLLDEQDYFILETWSNSAYARSFYQVMQNLDLNRQFVIITDQKIVNGKKKPALFVKQDTFTLKWCYVKDNMQDCPQLEISTAADGSVKYDDTLQNMFFIRLVEEWLIPELKRKPNPFPHHPVYQPAPPAITTHLPPPPAEDPDDLPF